MPKDESFLLMSLKDSKAKRLAQIISNDTCRKLLGYLSKTGESTEAALSKALEMPASTVHYNMQQLVGAGLVHVDEFHYSSKGREVNHYKLSNKLIVILPGQETPADALKKKFVGLLPVGLLSLTVAGILHLIQTLTSGAVFYAPLKSRTDAYSDALVSVDTVHFQAEAALAEAAPGIAEASREPSIAIWFLFGSVFALLIYLTLTFFKSRKK